MTYHLAIEDPKQLLEFYLRKEYSNLTLQNLDKSSKQGVSLDPGQKGIKRFIDYSNHTLLIAVTDNQRPLCDWCRGPMKDDAIGIPIKYTYQESIDTHKFDCDDTCACSLSCAYAVLKSSMKLSYRYRHGSYVDSETLLLLWHKLLDTHSSLRPAPDWKLHERNGGPLNDKQYYSSSYTYQQLPKVLISNSPMEHAIYKT
jgi:hypothetical protein